MDFGQLINRKSVMDMLPYRRYFLITIIDTTSSSNEHVNS